MNRALMKYAGHHVQMTVTPVLCAHRQLDLDSFYLAALMYMTKLGA